MAVPLKTPVGTLSLVLVGLLLGGAGCHKPAPAAPAPQPASADSTPQPAPADSTPQQAPPNPTPQQASPGAPPLTLDEGLARLRTQMTSANTGVQSKFYHGVSFNLRYGNYPAALAALQQIASDPSLTEEQKKTVSTVAYLLKAQAAQQPGAAAN